MKQVRKGHWQVLLHVDRLKALAQAAVPGGRTLCTLWPLGTLLGMLGMLRAGCAAPGESAECRDAGGAERSCSMAGMGWGVPGAGVPNA